MNVDQLGALVIFVTIAGFAWHGRRTHREVVGRRSVIRDRPEPYDWTKEQQ